MHERSDEALMQAWAGGSMAAFEQLYERYRGPLYRYILRLAGNEVTANDLYQGCWEKVIRARRRYRPAAPFRAWLFRIARNHVVDHYRRERPSAELREEQLESNNPGPDVALAEQGREMDLRQAVDTLPDEQRDFLLLKLEAGIELQTIADISGIGRETAKSRLRYALAKLRKTLEET